MVTSPEYNRGLVRWRESREAIPSVAEVFTVLVPVP